MAVPSTINDLNVSEGSNSPGGTDTVTTSTGPDDYIRALSAIIKRTQTKGANTASASTVDIGAIVTGEFIHITGTTTITAFGTVAAGVERVLVFDGALTLTHNATSLILPGGANITTAAGDVAVMRSEGSGNWRCVGYQKASGEPVVAGSYQPLDSDLTAIAALTTTAFGRGMLTYADAATAFAALKQAATTAATGVVEKATSGEMTAGTADKYPDAAEVKTYVDTAVAASPQVIKQVVTAVIPAASGTSTVPIDNTSPTSTEGTQIVTAAITPADNTNKVLIRASFSVSHSHPRTLVASVFNGTTNIGTFFIEDDGTNIPAGLVSIDLLDSPATASPVTYSIRFGMETGTGTWYVNQTSAGNTFGGSPALSIMSLEEVSV